jgi:hypothetical protein
MAGTSDRRWFLRRFLAFLLIVILPARATTRTHP